MWLFPGVLGYVKREKRSELERKRRDEVCYFEYSEQYFDAYYEYVNNRF